MYRLYKILLSLAVGVCGHNLFTPAQYMRNPGANDQAASFVIGQTGFGLNASSVTATGLNQPWGVVIDPVTGKVFVSDVINNRILRYPSAAVKMTKFGAALPRPCWVSLISLRILTDYPPLTLWQTCGRHGHGCGCG